jgi:hypothetical protein
LWALGFMGLKGTPWPPPTIDQAKMAVAVALLRAVLRSLLPSSGLRQQANEVCLEPLRV